MLPKVIGGPWCCFSSLGTAITRLMPILEEWVEDVREGRL